MNKFYMANLPTRIEKVKTEFKNIELYIKRDDQTGFELSGNKIRKLDYTLFEAIKNGCDTIITCGGIQSNHCRATAIASKKLGLDVFLVLKSDENDNYNGNYFLNELIGTKIKKISLKDYQEKRNEIMENLKMELIRLGKKPYVIPEGASNGLGNLGYINAFDEIIKQENEMNIHFDYIVAPMGSGSTHGGLYIGSKLNNSKLNETKIIGYNIYNKEVDSPLMIYNIINETSKYMTMPEIALDEIIIRTNSVGEGYALNTKEELEFIKKFIRETSIIIDTVYTGKALYGMYKDIEGNYFEENSKILFIHTGGVFGNFAKLDSLK